MRTSTGLAPHLSRTHGNKSTLLPRAESPSVPTQATAVAGPSRPPTHVLETHNSVPETDGALAHSSKFNAPRAPLATYLAATTSDIRPPPSPQSARSKARRPRTPQHTNAASGSATSSDRHTNGHGSVGAYNTAPTSPTTRRPPGPVLLSGDGAAPLLDCTPLQQAPPRPTRGPSRCIAQATRLRAAQPIGLHPPPMAPSLW